jgi:serine/threonine protein kinase
VDAYRGLALPYAQSLSFRRTRPVKEALVTNLLDLLQWLDHCRVALRDLKPDNLLVSGSSGRYPTFLASAGDFSIGLIDLETAVICPDPGNRWRQPQLGGTPTYATPSNFSPNRVLENCYSDIERIFFLQDWHAVICIIFSIVTGRRLLTEAAGLLPDLIEALSEAAAAKKPLEPEFLSYNARFWSAARDEFAEKVKQYAGPLQAVSVEVPETVMEKLAVFFDWTLDELERQVLAAVESQEVVRNPRARSDLCNCSHQALIRAMEKSGSSTVEGNGEQLQALFDRLSSLKKRQERIKQLQRHLQIGQGRMIVRHLLELMFERVFLTMFDAKEAVAPAQIDQAAGAATVKAPTIDYTLSFTHTADL